MPRQRKFTDHEVQEIRRNLEKKSQRQLARIYGCSQQAIYRIQKRKSYKDID